MFRINKHTNYIMRHDDFVNMVEMVGHLEMMDIMDFYLLVCVLHIVSHGLISKTTVTIP